MIALPDAGPRRAAALLLGVMILFGLAGSLDTVVAERAAAEPHGLHALGIFVSQFGLSGYMLVISGLLVVWAGWRDGAILGVARRVLAERAAFVFVAIAWSGILCQAIKHAVGRARPRFVETVGAYHVVPLSWRSGTDSFPSGHTTTVFALAVALSLLMPSRTAVFFAFAFTIALARILAGAHYPSDVIGGAALGSATALWTARAFAARHIAFAAGALPRLVLKRDTRRTAA